MPRLHWIAEFVRINVSIYPYLTGALDEGRGVLLMPYDIYEFCKSQKILKGKSGNMLEYEPGKTIEVIPGTKQIKIELFVRPK